MWSRQQTKHVEAVLPYSEGRAATGGYMCIIVELNNAEQEQVQSSGLRLK